MTETSKKCSRCGAVNPASGRLCYACGQGIAEDFNIPDPLLDSIRAAPENPPIYPREQRVLIASVITIASICLYCLLIVWVLLVTLLGGPFGLPILAIFHIGPIYGLYRLWSWALKRP